MNSISQEVIHRYMNHPSVHDILRGKLNGGHFGQIHGRSEAGINNLVTSIHKNVPYVRERMAGSVPLGGSTPLGGSGVMAGSLHLGGALQNHKDMYHFALNLSPAEFELLREIAVQLLGGKPSPMWGKMTEGNESLESSAENYEHIFRMPNQHSAAKMLEAEYGSGKGAGFGKAFKHVARLGSKIYKAGHHALSFVNRNKDLLVNLLPAEYKADAEAFLETANRIDDAVNPIVDATIDAVKQGATQEDKDKLKRLAENKIKQVVEERVPHGKDVMKLAKDINETYKNINRPLYAD